MSWKNVNSTDGMMVRVINGIRGWCVQSFGDMNKKKGIEWEASRSVALAAIGTKVYSLIVVGSSTVTLKSRILGATGAGLFGRAYIIQPSDVDLTLATPDPWYNFRTSYFGTQPLVKLYPGTEITFVTPVVNLAVPANKIFADINAITNAQNQAAGVVPQNFASDHILEPGDYILLEIESFDAAQTGTAGVEISEGELDYPNTDGL